MVFDRLLARITLELGDAVTLKGGLAVELRIERARTTKDVDLRVMGPPDDILDRLRAAAKRDLGDFMVFTIRPDDRHPDIQNDGMQYDGVRFRAERSIGGEVYGRPFVGDADRCFAARSSPCTDSKITLSLVDLRDRLDRVPASAIGWATCTPAEEAPCPPYAPCC